MNHLTVSPGCSSPASSGSPPPDRRGLSDETDENSPPDRIRFSSSNQTSGCPSPDRMRIRFPSDENSPPDESSNFNLPMFGSFDRELDFTNFRPFPPVAPSRNLIQIPSKLPWGHVSEPFGFPTNQFRGANNEGVNGYGNGATYENTERKPDAGSEGGNGHSIFDHMDSFAKKAGNFPVALPAAAEGHGRSVGQPNSLANFNQQAELKILEEALQQVRVDFNAPPPAVDAWARQQQALANILALGQMCEIQRNQNVFDAGNAMMNMTAMQQQLGGGFGQDPRYGHIAMNGGNKGLEMRPRMCPIPPNYCGERMSIRLKFGELGHDLADLDSPHGFAIGRFEEIVVADTNHHKIKIFDKEGIFLGSFGRPGKDDGYLWHPRKVTVIRDNGFFVVCDRGGERSRMQIFTERGKFVKQINIRFVDIVAGLATTADGMIVVIDSVRPTIYVINPENGLLCRRIAVANIMTEPSDIAIYNNNFYVCDFKGHAIVVIDFNGQQVRRISTEGISFFPNGVDVSDEGDILVGDSHGNQFHVAVFDRSGKFVSHFICPQIKVSRCCGLKITSEGYIVTVAKNNHHVLLLNTIHI